MKTIDPCINKNNPVIFSDTTGILLNDPGTLSNSLQLYSKHVVRLKSLL
ncbi:MAG: hypothetical protein JXB49_29210 [Bacteroidales bacterium]|nr:hypothetical protein [Bacteroidales bacterium]